MKKITHKTVAKTFATAGLFLSLTGFSDVASSQVALECVNDQALPLPLEVSLSESDKSGTVKIQYSKHTKCEFLARNWVYSPHEIHFEFSIDIQDCGKSLTPLKAKLDRKSGILTLSPANGSGDTVPLNCTKSATGNKF